MKWLSLEQFCRNQKYTKLTKIKTEQKLTICQRKRRIRSGAPKFQYCRPRTFLSHKYRTFNSFVILKTKLHFIVFIRLRIQQFGVAFDSVKFILSVPTPDFWSCLSTLIITSVHFKVERFFQYFWNNSFSFRKLQRFLFLCSVFGKQLPMMNFNFAVSAQIQ